MIKYDFRYMRGDEPASLWMAMKPEHVEALLPRGFEGKEPREIAQKVADVLAVDTSDNLTLVFQWRDTKEDKHFVEERQVSSRGKKHE